MRSFPDRLLWRQMEGNRTTGEGVLDPEEGGGEEIRSD